MRKIDILAFAAMSLAASGLAHADEKTRKLAARLPEEAAVFAHEAVKYVGEETLHQHAVKEQIEERPGVIKSVWQDRTVVSQYSFVTFREAPETVREMRQIVAIDGKKGKSEKSLKSVAGAVTASDERQKRKLLEDFEKAGLVGVATDLGQLLLLFSGRKIQNYDFSFQSQKFVGTDSVSVFTYSQVEGGGMTVYRDKATMRPKLSGEIWVDGEYRPLKVTLVSMAETPDKTKIRQEIEVFYNPGAAPCVLPLKALHRELRDGVVSVENEYVYSGFRTWEEVKQ